MSWQVLRSAMDRSVNFVRPAPDGGMFEARFVARSDDYAIAYLSSHSGCRLACRFCHLTQTGQTMFAPASHWDLIGQLMRVLQHMDEREIRPPRLHVNFMARGEPLANPHITASFEIFAARATEETRRRGMGVRFNLSTVFPADRDVELKLMPAEGGAATTVVALRGGQGTINVPCWAPSGRTFAFVRFES